MSLRVRAPLPPGDVRRGRGEVGEDPYMSRLVKLVPAEAIGTYPVLMASAQELAPPVGSGPRWTIYFVAWVLMIIVIVLRWAATSEPGKGPQWGGILIAVVAFFIWVHVLGGDFGFEMLLKHVAGEGQDAAVRGIIGSPAEDAKIKQFVSNVSLTAWTMLAPVVYRGDDQG